MRNQNELEAIVNKLTRAAEEAEKEKQIKAAEEAEKQKEAEELAKNPPAEDTQKEEPSNQPEEAVKEVASQSDAQKQKMAKIREALATANDADADGNSTPQKDADTSAEVVPVPTANLRPLKRTASKPAQTDVPAPVKTKSSQGAKSAASAQKKKSTSDAQKNTGKKNASVKSSTSSKKKTSGKKKSSKKKSASKAPFMQTYSEALLGKKPPKGDVSEKEFIHNGELTRRARIYGISGAVCVAAIIGFFAVAGTYSGKFLPNTLIDTVDVAGMTTAEARISLVQAKPVPDLKLTTASGDTVVFKASDFDAQYVVPDGALNEADAEKSISWLGKLFSPTEYAIDYDMYFDYGKLQTLIEAHDWGDAVSENAQVVRNDSGVFEVRPETQGDEFDVYALMGYIMEQLTTTGNTNINMEDSGCYDRFRAEITEEDLIPELELYNNYANCTITYDFDDRTKVVDSHKIVDWIMTDDTGAVMKNKSGQVIFNFDAVTEFVAKMAEETDTYGKDRTFNSTTDGTITVPWTGYPYSNYGWEINQTDTVNQLIRLMRDGQTVTVEPIYTHQGYVRKTDDIGDSYVDVDISEQHMWVYIDGKMVFDADFVSGTETNPGRRTPRGVCRVVGKAQGVTLGTYEVQGYEQWVAYWIPFNNWGCGFHDLSRGAYGGQIYMYNGSHGCLNMRLSEVKELYDILEENMPVMVHD